MNSILHVVPGLGERWSGIAVAAKLLAKEQGAELVDARIVDARMVARFDEVWVHSTWSWSVWRACRLVRSAEKKLVRMTHGNLDPVRLAYHRIKKHFAGPVERYFLRRADVVIATCETEANWILTYEPKIKSVELTDLKRFFNLINLNPVNPVRKKLHLLYLGRRHPLKGLNCLEVAVRQLQPQIQTLESRLDLLSTVCKLQVVSNAFGEEKEKVWDWCDVLVLPTLSDNFGLVIAEALERGKRVITTDGAPAWNHEIHETHEKGVWSGYGGRLIYLKGYRDGSAAERVHLLMKAITGLTGESQ